MIFFIEDNVSLPVVSSSGTQEIWSWSDGFIFWISIISPFLFSFDQNNTNYNFRIIYLLLQPLPWNLFRIILRSSNLFILHNSKSRLFWWRAPPFFIDHYYKVLIVFWPIHFVQSKRWLKQYLYDLTYFFLNFALRTIRMKRISIWP